MLKYNTNPNLRLLTLKLQEEVEDPNQNVHVFPETLKRTHQYMCGKKYI